MANKKNEFDFTIDGSVGAKAPPAEQEAPTPEVPPAGQTASEAPPEAKSTDNPAAPTTSDAADAAHRVPPKKHKGHKADAAKVDKLDELKKKKIKGVFSSQNVLKVGTGTTTRRTIQKTYWMVEEQDSGVIDIQPLNPNFIPSGPKRKVSKEDLLQKFSPEPEFYVQTVFPALQELNKTIVKGEQHRKKGELFSAEHQYNKALKVDVENVRANFGLGLTYLDRGETNKADNIFERLVKLDAAFEEEHKHLFNDFGISLRKNKMYDQSIDYYERALDLTKQDEHLHYNMARVFYEKKLFEKALDHLTIALKMNPDFEAAGKFLSWMQKRGLVVDGVAQPGAEPPAAAPDAGEAAPEKPAGDPGVDYKMNI